MFLGSSYIPIIPLLQGGGVLLRPPVPGGDMKLQKALEAHTLNPKRPAMSSFLRRDPEGMGFQNPKS